jgi:hypothetical protein
VTVLLLALVVSHWVLDAIAHEPDMPLLPGAGPRVGLGLWHSLPLTLVVEGVLFAGAVFFYVRGRRLGLAFWGLMALLVVLYAASLAGPPPPSATAIGLTMAPLIPLLWWWGNKIS